jgi:hypothetical protein
MPINYYDRFLEFLLWMAIGFFAGNGIEHLATGYRGAGKNIIANPPADVIPGGVINKEKTK